MILAHSLAAEHQVTAATPTEVIGWGHNLFGQRDVPSGLSNVVAIAAGGSHNLALTADGRVAAWGLNNTGQSAVPPGLTAVVAIDAGANHSLALTSDGRVVAWGDNSYGKTNVPSELSNVVAIAAGSYHSLALRADGTLLAWGRNSSGQTNLPHFYSPAAAIAAGGSFNLELRADDVVTGWGANSFGQCNKPTYLPDLVAIAAGEIHSLGLTAGGRVVAWGYNLDSRTTVPSDLSNVVAIAAGGSHNLALRTDGGVVAWGNNQAGQTTLPPGLSNVVAISAGASHSLALIAAGKLVLSSKVVDPGADVALATSCRRGCPAIVQWYFRGTNLLADAMGPTLMLTNLQTEQFGEYMAVTTFPFARVTNTVITLYLGSDLQVAGLGTPPEGKADSSLGISWTTVNGGHESAPGPWVDRVYLSTDSRPGEDLLIGEFPHTGALATNEACLRVQQVILPPELEPNLDYWWIVTTDAANAVEEEKENNNTRVSNSPMRLLQAAERISHARASQRAGTTLVDLYYDLNTTATNGMLVAVTVSTNGGLSYDFPAMHFIGDVGLGITAGTNKWIVWDVDKDWTDHYSTNVFFLITALDPPPGMAAIPAGSFVMGDALGDSQGVLWELPLHTNYVSAVYMDQYEVTKGLWDTVYQWAITNGYAFRAGNSGYEGQGKQTNHPVCWVDWSDAVKWCNARSEREGLVPAYYTSATLATVYRNGFAPMRNDWVKWHTGYRLPTEAEWEKAARGGASGHRFPWTDSDTISHDRANYFSSVYVTWMSPPTNTIDWDTSSTPGYHPDFWDIYNPLSSPVGYFAPNGYGLYDMVGNMAEWCWDWYDRYSALPASDPRGTVLAGVGNNRVVRGGGWSTYSYQCRCASRSGGTTGNEVGFRPVLPPAVDCVAHVGRVTVDTRRTDLQVASLDTPLQALANSTQRVAWTILNQGAAAAVDGWVDRVFLSTDATVGDDRLLGEFPASGPLGAKEALSRTQSIALPDDLEPDRDYWWVVVTDAGNAIDEKNEENNVRVSDQPMRLLRVPAPNLRVPFVSVSAGPMSGQLVTISWAVTNAGSWSTGAGLWHDAVYLSTNSILDAAALPVGRAPRPHPLGTNDTYASSLTLPLPQNRSGTCHFIVLSDADNRVNEGLFEGDNATAGGPVTVTLTPPPDLQVGVIQAPPTAFSGGSFAVSWRVTNAGPGITVESRWCDEVYLAETNVLTGNTIPLGSFFHEGVLTNGEAYDASASIRLPEGISGTFYLLVQTDSRTNVFEHVFDTNNVAAGASPIVITLTPPPDLVVSQVTAQAAGLASHSSIIRYTVSNLGSTSSLTPVWEDRLYLTRSLPSDPGSLPQEGEGVLLLASQWHYGGLGIGEAYTNSVEVWLPEGASGTYYALVLADAGNEVFELLKTNNVGVSLRPMQIESRPADLVVSGLSAPAVASSGASLLVSWTVKNQGSGDTVVSRWSDRLVLSSDAVAGGADDITLLTLDHNGLLDAGVGYAVTNQVVTIPWTVGPGSWRLFAVADADNAVYEASNEGNNASFPQNLVITRATADLRVASLSLVPTRGESQSGKGISVLSEEAILVSWRVENIGPAAPNSSVWSDGVYLSTNAVLDGSAILLGTRQNPVTLASRGFYTNDLTITLPAEIQGDFHVFVQTDSDGRVIEEGGKANNTLAATNTLHLTLRPVPDLAVPSVTTPPDGYSGRLFEVSWTVTNTGPAAAEGMWYDSVYLSQDLQFEPGLDTYIGYAERPTLLANGQAYTQTAWLEIPADVSGLLYVFVVCDSTQRVNERGATTNNIGRAALPAAVWLQPPADLVVGTVTIPTNAVAGYEMALTYTLRNQGTNAAFGPWVDALYLSADEQWDYDDALFARVSQIGTLVPGGNRTNTVSAPTAGVLPDNYHVIMRTDVVNQVPETNEFNNVAASLDEVVTQVEELALGASATKLLTTGGACYYRVHAAAGQRLVVELSGDSPAASTELFVRHDAIPTRAAFDFLHSNPLQPNHRIIVPDAKEGDYYILVYGDLIPAPGAAAFTLTVRLSEFGVFTTSFGRGGNAGNLTLLIDGVDFDRTCTAALTNMAGLGRTAVSHYCESSTQFYPTFDLRGLAPGIYTVVVHKGDGSSVAVPDSLQVVEAAGIPTVVSTVTAHSALKRFVAYTFSVQWGNFGLNDAPVPLLTVGNTVPFSLVADGDSLGTRYTFLGINTRGGPPGILRPGQNESITFHARSGGESRTYSAVITRPLKETEMPFNWDLYRAGLKPTDMSEAEFDQAFQRLVEWVGRTNGQVQDSLPGLISVMARADRHTTLGELLGLKLQRIRAELSTSISGRIEAADPATSQSDRLVSVVESASRQAHSTLSHGDGFFVFPNLPPGTYELSVASLRNLDHPVVSVTNGQALGGLVLRVERGGAISGLIKVGYSSPLADAFVILFESSRVSAATIADSAGAFQFEGLEGGAYRLRVEAGGYATCWTEGVSTNSSSPHMVFLVPESKLEGQPIDDHGQPLVGVTVQAVLRGGLPGAEFDGLSDSGGFRLQRLTSGIYDVTLSMPGGGSTNVSGVSVPRSATVDLGAIVMPQGRMARLAGPVLPPIGPCDPEATLDFLERGVLQAAFAYGGVETVDLYTEYFRSCFLHPNPRALSATLTEQFKNNDTTREVLEVILRAASEYIQTQIPPLPCEHPGVNKDFSIRDITWPPPWDRDLLGDVLRTTLYSDRSAYDLWTFGSGAPKALAGGVGLWGSGCGWFGGMTNLEFREVSGSFHLNVPANSHSGTVTGNLSVHVEDCVDYEPGNVLYNETLGFGWLEWCATRECAGLYWDVPFTVDFRANPVQTSVSVPSTGGACADESPSPDDITDTLILRAYDPNDIMGPRGFGPEQWVAADRPFLYTIRFENDPKKADVPAQYVRITQVLDANLDLRTFRLGGMGFGTNLVDVPADRAFYRASMNLTNALGVFVEVVASLDLAKGEATWEFVSIDPETGEWPWDPYIGFLPPDTDGIIGQGFVSYTIQPKPGVASGDIVHAQACIFFDYNEPMDTPHIFNTIDAGLPTSTVLPLPTSTNRNVFAVRWEGVDGFGSSGIGSFDIYASDNSGPWQLWLRNTPYLELLFAGECGHTYAFHSVARDHVGNQEAATGAVQTSIHVLPNSPPVLAPLTNQVIHVGQQLVITNTATDLDWPAQALTFSFEPGAPDGMSIDPLTGLLRWRPTCAQGNSSNVVTLRVTDDGCGGLSSKQRFAVVVTDCLQVALGEAVAQMGQDGCMPVYLESSDSLTNLVLTIQVPPNRFTNFTAVAIAPELRSVNLAAVDATHVAMSLVAQPGRELRGPKQVASLCFTLRSPQSSAFLPVEVVDLVGLRNDGTALGNTTGRLGRVVVVGNEPLLEAVRGSNGESLLVVYGPPGAVNLVESKMAMGSPDPWQPAMEVRIPATSVSQVVAVPQSQRTMFYRAHRE